MAALSTDRRLGWGLTEDGVPLVATGSGLHIGEQVLAWTDLEKAVWRPPVLLVTEVAPVAGTGRTSSFSLAQDDHLAEVVRAQVTSSVGWSDRRGLSPSGHVRVVGRRVPGRDGLLWQSVYESAADADDPAKRAQVEQLVASLQRTIG